MIKILIKFFLFLCLPIFGIYIIGTAIFALVYLPVLILKECIFPPTRDECPIRSMQDVSANLPPFSAFCDEYVGLLGTLFTPTMTPPVA